MLTPTPPPPPARRPAPRSKLRPYMVNRWAQATEVEESYAVWANMGGSLAPKPVIVSLPKYGSAYEREEFIFSSQVGGLWAGPG